MKILLVRHGESEANQNKLVHTTTADHAIGLSCKGEDQAFEAGRFLRDFFMIRGNYDPYHPRDFINSYDHIRMWVSPYKRARQTAELIRSKCSRINDVRENIHLVEQQFGLFDGMSHEGQLSEIQHKYPNEYAHYKKQEDFEGRFWARMPLGESRFDVALRVHQCFGTFHRDAKKHDINTIVVVAHGLSIRAFVMQWLHLSPEWFEKEPNPKNCSIRLIEDGEDRGYIYNP